MARHLKEEFEKIQTVQDKAADKITAFSGSMMFVYLHAIVFAVWIIYNLSAVKSYQAAVALAPNEESYRISLALELIRHKSFEPARVVLEQAEQSRPDSWRVQVALGMVEYFAGSAEDATRTLLKAAI